MSDCSKHKKEVAGVSDMKKLAEMIGDLHYESLAHLLVELNIKLYLDSSKDFSENRIGLSNNLNAASNRIQEAAKYIYKAWQISKPFMQPQHPPADSAPHKPPA